MQLFITQRQAERGLAAEVLNTGHKLKHGVVFQAPKVAISEQTQLVPSSGHWERLLQAVLSAHHSQAHVPSEDGTSAILHGITTLGCD